MISKNLLAWYKVIAIGMVNTKSISSQFWATPLLGLTSVFFRWANQMAPPQEARRTRLPVADWTSLQRRFPATDARRCRHFVRLGTPLHEHLEEGSVRQITECRTAVCFVSCGYTVAAAVGMCPEKEGHKKVPGSG